MWIEIVRTIKILPEYESRPARALWIEIHHLGEKIVNVPVEAREGLVD